MNQRFITLPISLPGDGDNPDKAVPCQLDPTSVMAYHEGYVWGTFIYLTTGQAFCSTLTVEEYEALCAEYFQSQSAVHKLPF